MQPGELTAAPSAPAVERFTVGLALSRSWGVWLQNLPLFLGVAVLAHVPEFIVSCLRLGQPPTRLGQRVETLSTSFLAYVVTGLVTYSVLEQLRGRRPSARKSISMGLAGSVPWSGRRSEQASSRCSSLSPSSFRGCTPRSAGCWCRRSWWPRTPTTRASAAH